MFNIDFSRIDWEDIWQWFVLIIAICGAVIVGKCIFADKTIKYYYLEGSTGELNIYPHIEWVDDSSYGIKLDRTVSYEEALKMVSRMNDELRESKNNE